MAQVVFEGVSKTFPGKGHAPVVALEGICLAVNSGERLAVVGPSGSGKTTLLRLIAGLDAPTEGKLRIDGRSMESVAPEDRHVAMVAQSPALFPHLSVSENLGLGLKLRRRSPDEIAERTREVAATLGLTHCLDRLPGTLAGGERQRVALGRAIACRPRIFLFDEPLAALDTPLRDELRESILQLHERLGTTMIFVTHDQAEALAVGQRVVVLNRGRIEQIATPLELYGAPANLFVAGFIGSPPMNCLRGTVRRSGSGFSLEVDHSGTKPAMVVSFPATPETATKALLAARVDREVVLGVRPEHLNEGPGSPDTGRLEAMMVDRVEPLGAETRIRCAHGDCVVHVRLPGEMRVRTGQALELHFRPTAAHWFDPATGANLRMEMSTAAKA